MCIRDRPKEEMKQLAQDMKEAGKTTYLEVVTYDEESCLDGAKTAVECGFDQLMGTLYYPSVHEYLRAHEVVYKMCIRDRVGPLTQRCAVTIWRP